MNNTVNPGAQARPRLSIVIPVYADARGLRTTLRSIDVAKRRVAFHVETVVVNDGACSNVAEVAESFGAERVDVAPRKGSYYCRNRGIEVSIGTFVAFVDADIEVLPNWLADGVAALGDHDYVGGPVIIPQNDVRTAAHHYEFVTAFNTRTALERRKNLPTANLFVNRQVFDAVGKFDERLHSGGDVEFGQRVFLSGQFNQGHRSELSVLHPPRGYRGMLNKTRRVERGQALLYRLYPTRFPYLRPSFSNVLRKLMTPAAGYLIKCRRKGERVRLAALAISLWFGVVAASTFLAVPLRRFDERTCGIPDSMVQP